MITILSPAKIMDFKNPSPLPDYSQPEFLKEAGRLIKLMQNLDMSELSKLLDINSNLTIDEIVTKIALGAGTSSWSPNYGLFKVSPRVLDSIFVTSCDSTVDTDQFLVESFFDVKVVQNLDYDGMPY